MWELVMNEFNLAVLHLKWPQLIHSARYNASNKYDDDDQYYFPGNTVSLY